MRRTLVLAAAVLTLAGCSSTPSTPSSTTPANVVSSSTSQPAAACNLTSKGDIIERVVTPGNPATAEQLGSINLAQCKLAFDTLAQETSTDPGFCSQEAWLADNPNYDVNAVPAPPLKKVQAQAGGGCGQG